MSASHTVVLYDGQNLQLAEFVGHFDEFGVAQIINTGLSIKIYLCQHTPIILKVPMNPNFYMFDYLEIHWADIPQNDPTTGSTSKQVAVQAVHHNGSYKSFGEACVKPDSLVIVLLTLQSKPMDDAPEFGILAAAMENISKPHSSVFVDGNCLEWMKNTTLSKEYYTWKDSLSTLPNIRSINWISYLDPVYISHSQLDKIRSVLTG